MLKLEHEENHMVPLGHDMQTRAFGFPKNTKVNALKQQGFHRV